MSDPSDPANDAADPGAHLVMAVFGALTYELNKCAITAPEVNVVNCHWQLQVCRSYAAFKGDFSSVLAGAPTKLIEDISAKTSQKERTHKTARVTTI